MDKQLGSFCRLICAAGVFVALIESTATYAYEETPVGAGYEVGFSQTGDALRVVLSGIRSAKTSILVAAYSFTSKPIATALLDAHKRGVRVAVVAEEQQNIRAYSAVRFLANKGVPVRLNGRAPALHQKFMVIDLAHVETGSMNYSSAAEKNAENALMLWHVKPLAQAYGAEWQRLWNDGEDLKPAY